MSPTLISVDELKSRPASTGVTDEQAVDVESIVRTASEGDVDAIHRLVSEHTTEGRLLPRSREEIGARIGRFIVEKLNRMEGPVRFLVPEGGVSLVDAAGKPFWDPAADRALFDTITSGFRPSANRKLLRLPHNLNDSAFSDALVAAFDEVVAAPAAPRARVR